MESQSYKQNGFLFQTDSKIAFGSAVWEINAAGKNLDSQLVREMPENHKEFIVSFFEGEPNWDKINLPDAKLLPQILTQEKRLRSKPVKERESILEEIKKLFDSL